MNTSLWLRRLTVGLATAAVITVQGICVHANAVAPRTTAAATQTAPDAKVWAAIDPALHASIKASPRKRLGVIVQVKEGEVKTVRKLVRKYGDKAGKAFKLIPAFAAKMRGENILRLAAEPKVTRISADLKVEKVDTTLRAPATPFGDPSRGYRALKSKGNNKDKYGKGADRSKSRQ